MNLGVRKLVGPWTIPGWMIVAWQLASHASTADFLINRAGSVHIFQSAPWWTPTAIGFLWLTLIVVWPDLKNLTQQRALEQIRFDYMPGSPAGNPLENGWKVAYAEDHPDNPPEFGVPYDEQGRDGLEMLARRRFAIHYQMKPATAVAAKRVRLAINYSDGAMFWLLVELSSKGNRRVERQLKIELQGASPRRPEQQPEYPRERTVWVPSKPLENGWAALDLRVAELVTEAWGNEGYALDRLCGVQLRGVIAVSPITLMQSWW